MKDEKQEHPDPHRWWRHRRWQSYISLVGVLAIGGGAVLGYIPDASVPVVQAVVWALVAVVLVYHVGASAVDAVKARAR